MVEGGTVHEGLTARRNVPLALWLAIVLLAGGGCSTKAWYEGARFSAQNECRRQPPGETESCLSRVNTMTYEEYERNRQGQKP
jgi:hypothetical protein